MGNYLGRGLDKISNIEILDNITFDGSSSYSITKGSVAFTPNSAQSCLISIDGVVQATNFSVNSSTIDFGVAVPSTSTCNFFLHYGTGVAFTPSDGSVTSSKLASGNLTIPNGNLLFDTADKGIYLGVTSATASNLLDDYEEGTWTPSIVVSGVGTITLSGGSFDYSTYKKIGNIVFLNFKFNFSSDSNSYTASTTFRNMPFTPSRQGAGSITQISHVVVNQTDRISVSDSGGTTSFNDLKALGSTRISTWYETS